MREAVLGRRPSWSVVALLVALAALLAAVLTLGAARRAETIAPYQLTAATSGVHTVNRVTLQTGQHTTLYQNNAFRVVAMCVDAGGGTFKAEFGVRALVDHTLVFSTDQGNTTDTVLNKADGVYHWSPDYEASSTTPLFYGYDYYQEFTAESPRGDLLIGRVSDGVHMRGAACIFDGLFVD